MFNLPKGVHYKVCSFFLYRDMKNTLALIKKKVGHGNVRKFIRDELGITYRTFVYQLHHGLVTYKMIRVIIDKLGISFDDFKDYEYTNTGKVHSQECRFEKNALKDLHTIKPKKLSELLEYK